jgi:hypothetical protein
LQHTLTERSVVAKLAHRRLDAQAQVVEKERALKKPAATLDGLDPAALTASNIKGCSNGDESEAPD